MLFNRIRFHLFFTKIPEHGTFCNSKLISIAKTRLPESPTRAFLVFIRSGGGCRLVDDGSERNFDIAFNLYARPNHKLLEQCEYLIVGGINKYKAAYQFLDCNILGLYQGFIFLDDDLEITYSELSGFLEFCRQDNLRLAQPSVSLDSYYSHPHLLNMPDTRSRRVNFVEVMCPYFSAEALKTASFTFDLSYSTWGLDYLWPHLPGIQPVVVDAFTIKHTKPIEANGGFYAYMRKIGISPRGEEMRLRKTLLGAKSAGSSALAPESDIGTS